MLTDGSAVPLGFYTLASTSIALANLPTALAARVPRYPIVPATLLGRLAVDAAHRGRGYGRSLLLDALARSLRSDIATYAVVVDPKDDAATGFYAQYGFVPLKSAGPRMFLPIAKAAWLFTG